MNASHTGFIVAAYAITFVVVGVAVGAILTRYGKLKRALARVEGAERDRW